MPIFQVLLLKYYVLCYNKRMFTGLIEEVGKILTITQSSISIEAKTVLEDVKIGDSIAVNGVCLTVVEQSTNSFTANVSKETFNVTVLSELKSGDSVNLERALTLNSRFGGHIVTGHIDTVSRILSISQNYEFFELKVSIPNEFEHYIVKKGSITINGISLTIAEVQNGSVTIAVIPHTYENTVLKYLKQNNNVNIEFDILAKYVEKILSTKNNSNITVSFLQENGFV